MIGAMSKRGQNTTSNDGSPTAKARPLIWSCTVRAMRKSLHEVWDLWSIWGMTMKEKESDKHQETGSSPTKKSRIFSSGSTREGSSSHQETGAERSNTDKK